MKKVYKLQWTLNAKNDLLNIVKYIEKDSPLNANEVYLKIKSTAKSSNFFPLKGRILPELQKQGITTYREVITAPWRIIYKVGGDIVYIMAILDSRQNLEDLLLQKLLKV
ncbi:MAG: type II toxin-antitoxin system RelE/ParE family toxin [Candidatus Thioglobus sp.]|jgi:addiction module RelE/StbE family toxin|uniref:type II toxin-antitoxin system RelE/ParE family toxin n=1 Tax=Candidatus Thioglobus sp. TaxID=2026721 RepID=UPI0001BD3659|nr:type II toxin-antitoxin system RelE/ParE family toxin [Candidatus Thioglobus sp.]EEZ80393.1 MAG: Addiction module toxin, RelE/StbE [uncultured Candidatus Thioglobus sp.]MBT3186923.1 type II toxin-antitoxin system RelE/ParE family toxin [Candidatus Thioglobus sp.]MBT3431056.1 type II toxin-antitoxin system RelE/ParE family toxin [Candidatus Thioglobus sp.]MBT3965822.1 type II toxin-antitoxin system RelE/ParE family toxin [Candidatus Thioglobus sp.]MBT4316000.1 type II toxin-antitoxin system 